MKCVLCGRTDEHETEYDHVRTAYLRRNGTFERGYYAPQLSQEDLFRAKAAIGNYGEFEVCNNRKKCRERRTP